MFHARISSLEMEMIDLRLVKFRAMEAEIQELRRLCLETATIMKTQLVQVVAASEVVFC